MSTVISGHPEVEAIVAAIRTTNERRQRRGWWFNLRLANLPTNVLPAGTTYARPLNRSLDYYPNNGMLHDRRTGAPVPGSIPDIELQVLVAFEDLPTEFAEYVATAAAMDYASDYDADELHIQALAQDLQDSQTQVHRLHIRYYETAKVSRMLQGRGWWFNTAVATLVSDATGVVVPPNILFARPLCGTEAFPSNGYMIDRETRQPVQGSLRCEVRYFVDDYNELPQSFQDYVAIFAEMSRTQDFLPESSSMKRLEAEMQGARTLVQQDHIKYSQVNLFSMPSVGIPLSKAWGSRYRRGM